MILLLLAIVAFFILNNVQSTEYVEFSAPVNLNKKFKFDDGTEGTLNDGSSIKTPLNSAILDLIGEAHFLVPENVSIKVKTNKGNIQATAANFNVRAWGDNLYVENYSGSAVVELEDQAIPLKGGQALNVVKGSAREVSAIRGKEPLWLGGIMRFYEVTMKDVCEELERQFDMEVVSTVDDMEFSGTFNHFNLDKALEQICMPMKLSYQRLVGRKIVIDKL